MCGIVGVFPRRGRSVDKTSLEKMTCRLAHRGPDGAGTWVDPTGCVGLGHRRLSVLDLSEAGAQPMRSTSSRYVITYNGEIYNFPALRRELEASGNTFRGHSDTEVALAAFEQWGVEKALIRFNGMFAFGVWDSSERRLWLVRDRLGIKPLYYAQTGFGLIFASELRALLAYGGVETEFSEHGLSAYLQYGYIPGPLSIFRSVHKLLPGNILCAADGVIRENHAYWSVDDVARRGVNQPLEGDDAESVAALEAALRQSVRRQMVSDVPVGAFLSGGIDSSTVTAIMQAESSAAINTFSIGFTEKSYNEAEFASAVAKYLGTRHTELYVSDVDAQRVIPELPDIYDEPFSDISQIPTYLVSRLARQYVTVALSGDGGDELFGGYNRYMFVSRFWRQLGILPLPVRRFMQRRIQSVSPSAWDSLFETARRLVPSLSVPSLPGQKMHKVAALLGSQTLQQLQDLIVSQWPEPNQLLRRGASAEGSAVLPALHSRFDDPVASQMLWDTHVYLADDILTKVDRASMHVGLEARVPLLDHTFVELAWRIPMSRKLRDGVGKWIMRRVLETFVPQHLFERPKMGFSVPIDQWLRGSLREWADSLLAKDRLEDGGYLHAEPIRTAWSAHLAGSVDRGTSLWTVLMLQAWRERLRGWEMS